MNKTRELLLQIKTAVENGKLQVDQPLLEDIIQCVQGELEMNRISFAQEQFDAILVSFKHLCDDYANGRREPDDWAMFLDALILALGMISPVARSLANGEYWEYMHRGELDDPEIREIVDFVGRNNRLQLLNYDFLEEYKAFPVEIFEDVACSMYFIPYHSRRMYFPKGWPVDKIENYFRSVVAEQDWRSPHCYASEEYGVREGDVVVDAGAAEGIFALDVIDKASEVYLIEADEAWADALEMTFAGDRDKVHIIRGFLNSGPGGDNVSLDQLFAGQQVNYIKMDIEGYEKQALAGGGRLLGKAKDLRCAICTYHCKEDEEQVGKLLRDYGFETATTRGYICPDWTMEAYVEAQLRRGVLFGKKIGSGQGEEYTRGFADGSETYDALVVVTPKDYVRLQSNYHRLLVGLPVRKIWFIGSEEVGALVEKSQLGERVGFIDENDILSFSQVHEVMKEALKDIVKTELPRAITGWYYQQFLKMQYSAICRDNYYLVWDGDTVPCRAFSMFQDGTDMPYLDLKTECHEEYFVTMAKMLPGMHKCIQKSFIAEHMLMKVDIMKELIASIEANANIRGESFWEKIIWSISADKLQENSFSEFETYGTYVALKHSMAYRLRDWHSFRYGGEFFDPEKITDSDLEWLGRDFFAISFEKGNSVREDHKNLFDNKEYQAKLSARQMLEIAQEEFGEESYRESWE